MHLTDLVARISVRISVRISADLGQDEAVQRSLGRMEVHFIKLRPGGRHWQLPYLDPSLFARWMLSEDFSLGYRHMCR